MPTETLTLDPTASPVELATGVDGFLLRSFDNSPPTRRRVDAISMDLEGAKPVASQHENRIITIVVRALPSATRAAWYAKLSKLEQKIGHCNAEGVQLKRIMIGSGAAHYYDLVDGQAEIPWDTRYALRMDTDITMKFLALPYAYGDEIALGVHSETVLPCITFTEPGIKGDVPAVGRLVVTDNSGASQQAMWWGVRSRNYDAAVTAKLYYEAEALTPMDVATAVGLSGGSPPTGNNTVRHAALPVGSWCPILSTDIAASGKMTHKGNYQVFARVYAVTDNQVQLRFTYGLGDLTSVKSNAPVVFPGNATGYRILDLGKVQLGKSSQWTGIVQGLAFPTVTTATQVWIDCLFFVPLDDTAGSAVSIATPPPSAVGVSKYPATSVNDASGGTLAWNLANWRVSSANAAVSNYLKVTNCGFAIPIAATILGVKVQIGKSGWGVAGMYAVDSVLSLVKAGARVGANKADTATGYGSGGSWEDYGSSADMWGTALTPTDVNNAGFGISWAVQILGTGTGGQLYNADYGWSQVTVFYGVPSVDAVFFASRSMEINDKGATRYNSSGAYSVPQNAYQGDYLRIPPAGVEARTAQFIVKASRAQLSNGFADSNIDKISAQVFYTPRWLMHPDS